MKKMSVEDFEKHFGAVCQIIDNYLKKMSVEDFEKHFGAVCQIIDNYFDDNNLPTSNKWAFYGTLYIIESIASQTYENLCYIPEYEKTYYSVVEIWPGDDEKQDSRIVRNFECEEDAKNLIAFLETGEEVNATNFKIKPFRVYEH